MEQIHREKAVIGARLRLARERALLSREDAADGAGVQVAAVQAWERGTNLPNLVQFKALLGCYGTTSLEILFGDELMRFSREEVAELRCVAQAFSPTLRRRMDFMLMLFSPACSGPIRTSP